MCMYIYIYIYIRTILNLLESNPPNSRFSASGLDVGVAAAAAAFPLTLNAPLCQSSKEEAGILAVRPKRMFIFDHRPPGADPKRGIQP